MKQEKISASEFKSKCLHLMEETAKEGKEFVITKRGKPISKLVPYTTRPASIFGMGEGKLKIHGDIVSPIDDFEWTADEENIR